jgi:hypothetical protein
MSSKRPRESAQLADVGPPASGSGVATGVVRHLRRQVRPGHAGDFRSSGSKYTSLICQIPLLRVSSSPPPWARSPTSSVKLGVFTGALRSL